MLRSITLKISCRLYYLAVRVLKDNELKKIEWEFPSYLCMTIFVYALKAHSLN